MKSEYFFKVLGENLTKIEQEVILDEIYMASSKYKPKCTLIERRGNGDAVFQFEFDQYMKDVISDVMKNSAIAPKLAQLFDEAPHLYSS